MKLVTEILLCIGQIPFTHRAVFIIGVRGKNLRTVSTRNDFPAADGPSTEMLVGRSEIRVVKAK